MADHGYEERRRKYKKAHRVIKAEPAPSYEGFSAYNDESTAVSFINAVKAAAKAAANQASKDNVELPAWYEVTRIRVLVGNPNVKVLGATITKGAPPTV
jgi:hypothetical protein